MGTRPFLGTLRAFLLGSLRRPRHISLALCLVIAVLAMAGIAGAENYKY